MGWGRKALIRGDEKAGRRNGAKIRRETFLERKVTACAVQERRCFEGCSRGVFTRGVSRGV